MWARKPKPFQWITAFLELVWYARASPRGYPYKEPEACGLLVLVLSSLARHKMASEETQAETPPSPPDRVRQRIGTMDKKWKDQIKKDKTIYKNLSEFVEKRRK